MTKIAIAKIAQESFTQAMQELLQQKLPIKTAWKVKSLTNQFNEELRKFSDLRRELLERYCKRDAEGKPVIDEHGNYDFEKESLETVIKEMNELGSIEVEFTPIKIDELGNIDLSAEKLFALGEVLCE